MHSPAAFHFYILHDTWNSLKLKYELQPAWATLQQVYTTTTAFDIGVEAIEAYDWSEQKITLTSEASSGLIAALAKSDAARLHPETMLDMRAFVVTLGDEPIYGGIFLMPMSAMGIKFPVVYTNYQDNRLSFTMRPTHSILKDYSKVEPTWYGIKDPHIEESLRLAGKLGD